MSRFHEGETEHFPVERTDKGVWYAIIQYDILFPRSAFFSSGTGKKAFLDKIRELRRAGKFYLLLGIWQGEWSTDLFVLDENTIVKMLERVIK
jgi:hypothetical protein